MLNIPAFYLCKYFWCTPFYIQTNSIYHFFSLYSIKQIATVSKIIFDLKYRVWKSSDTLTFFNTVRIEWSTMIHSMVYYNKIKYNTSNTMKLYQSILGQRYYMFNYLILYNFLALMSSHSKILNVRIGRYLHRKIKS